MASAIKCPKCGSTDVVFDKSLQTGDEGGFVKENYVCDACGRPFVVMYDGGAGKSDFDINMYRVKR